MTAQPILYSFFISSCSWRVRIALAYKRIAYEYRAVNLLKDEQTKPEFRALNPMAQVPSLVIDGKILSQSISMIEFLEEKYPERPLLPRDIFDRAQVREISELIGSGIQPLQNLPVQKMQKAMPSEEWCHHFNRKGLKALEKVLKKTSGEYSFKDQITMADCCLVPQVFSASIRFNVDMEEFPVTSRIYENLCEVKEFQVAHPQHQPDFPK